METSTGPNVSLFKRFQQTWSQINKLNWATGINDNIICEKLNKKGEDMLKFAMESLKEHHPREDYRELLELTVIFLGGIPPRGISFRVPGAFHHARWMAKAIYCIKIFLFRNEFNLKKEEEIGLREICVFLIHLYIKAWIRCSNPIEAPHNDFQFLKDLLEYKNIDKDISSITLNKFCNHLWYLAPQTAALSFFNDKVSTSTKKKMVEAIQLNNDTDDTLKKFPMNPKIVKNYTENGLEQFISIESHNFFNKFNISTDFMCLDPSTWKKNENYIKGLHIANNLRVVNDTAERGVKLMEDYNNLLTKNEQQKQYVLQVVADYKRKYPDCKKQTLSKPIV